MKNYRLSYEHLFNPWESIQSSKVPSSILTTLSTTSLSNSPTWIAWRNLLRFLRSYQSCSHYWFWLLRISISLKNAIIQIIWSLMGVPFIILLFIIVLRVSCIFDLQLSPNFSWKLKRNHKSRYEIYAAIAILYSKTKVYDIWSFYLSYTFWYTSLSSYEDCSLGIMGASYWVTHFSSLSLFVVKMMVIRL